MNVIDAFLNRVTAYRLALSSLGILAAISILEAFIGWLPYTALDLSISLFTLLFASYAVNSLCTLFTKATPTPESSYITALILFFILTPIQSSGDVVLLMAGAAIAMVSKYLIAWRGRHIFNPAAVAVIALGIAGTGLVSWWIATLTLLPVVLVIGFLFVRKLRCSDIVLPFFISATVIVLIEAVLVHQALWTALLALIEVSPLIFVGTIMMTDPQTMPTARSGRATYGAIAGIIFPLSLTIGPIVMPSYGLITNVGPTVGVAVANGFGFMRRLRRRIRISFAYSEKRSRDTYEYVFVPEIPFAFAPGQHLEWTIEHKRADKRGIRRHFHLTSIPGDPHISFLTSIPVESSTFKDALRILKKGAYISAASPNGRSLISYLPSQKIGLIANGTGIAAFIGMFRYLAQTRQRRDIVLIYAAPSPLDFAYQEELDSFKQSIGLKILYLPTDFTELSGWDGASGFVTNEIIQKQAPDFLDRVWYFAGPAVTVENYQWLMRSMGVSRKNSHAISFPGF